jgi:25S rRNA (cytosine2278-C5)-methyltransferase
VLQHKKLLIEIIEKSKILEKEQFLGEVLAQLLVYDVLFGIGVRGKFKGLVKRNYDELNKVLEEIMLDKKCEGKDELLKLYDEKLTNKDLITKPKYIFLNQLDKTKKEIRNQLKIDNFIRIKDW